MNKRLRKLILLLVATLVLATSVTVYLLWNKGHKDVLNSPAIEITASDLYNIFLTDSAKANSLYTDKVVQVTGELEKTSSNQQAQQVLFIKTSVEGGYINCTMEEKAVDHKTGDHVTVKGICSGYIAADADMGLPGDVFLIRGYLIKP